MRNLLYICIIVFFIAGFFSCGNKNSEETISTDLVNNPLTANGDTTLLANLPKFEFVSEEHDFGRIIQDEVVSFSFKFKNVGKSDLIISSAKASCGCTVADFPKKPIAPGQESQITVTFDSKGKTGKVSKNVTILANTQPNVKVLKISVEISQP